MSSINPENVIITTASGSALGNRAQDIEIDNITAENITVSGTINGVAVGGSVVFATTTQAVSNKSLVDNSVAFVDSVDATKKVFIDCGGTAGTSSTLGFEQTVDRIYTIPDSGANCGIVTTEGAQTINGQKTVTDLVATALKANGFNLNDTVRIYSGQEVTTTNTTQTTLYAIASVINTVYIVTAKIIVSTAAGDYAVLKTSVRVRNLANTLSVDDEFDTWELVDAAIIGVGIQIATVSTNILVRVTGIPATTMTWRGTVEITSLAFA